MHRSAVLDAIDEVLMDYVEDDLTTATIELISEGILDAVEKLVDIEYDVD